MIPFSHPAHRTRTGRSPASGSRTRPQPFTHGRPGVTKPPFLKIIPHSDGAGVIEAVGKGGLESRIGERVWIWNGQRQRAYGTAADYIALPAEQAVRLPDNISFEQGAILGIPARRPCTPCLVPGLSTAKPC